MFGYFKLMQPLDSRPPKEKNEQKRSNQGKTSPKSNISGNIENKKIV